MAIKVLRSSWDSAARRRFEREQRVMDRLSDTAGFVPILETGETDDGSPYIVMPYYEGGSLQQRIARNGPIGWPRAVRLVEQVAQTLVEAHQLDVFHRDIKPANILLSEAGRPHVADFGISLIADDAASRAASTAAFTPAYSPPESFTEGLLPVATTDIYGLAATLWAILAGHAPFKDPGERPAPVTVFGRVAMHQVGDLRDRVPSPICQFIERSMAKRPDSRPEAMTDFLNELRAAREDAYRGVEAERLEADPLIILPDLEGGEDPSADGSVADDPDGSVAVVDADAASAGAAPDGDADGVIDLTDGARATAVVEPEELGIPDPLDNSPADTIALGEDTTINPEMAFGPPTEGGIADGEGTVDVDGRSDDRGGTDFDPEWDALVSADLHLDDISLHVEAFGADDDDAVATIVDPIAATADVNDVDVDPEVEDVSVPDTSLDSEADGTPEIPAEIQVVEIDAETQPRWLGKVILAALLTTVLLLAAWWLFSRILGDGSDGDSALVVAESSTSSRLGAQGDAGISHGVGGRTGGGADGALDPADATGGVANPAPEAEDSSPEEPPATVLELAVNGSTTPTTRRTTTSARVVTTVDGRLVVGDELDIDDDQNGEDGNGDVVEPDGADTTQRSTTTEAPTTATTATTSNTTTTITTITTTTTETTKPAAAISIVTSPYVVSISATSLVFAYRTNDVCGTGSFTYINVATGQSAGRWIGDRGCFGPTHHGDSRWPDVTLEPDTTYRIQITVEGQPSNGALPTGSGQASTSFQVTTPGV